MTRKDPNPPIVTDASSAESAQRAANAHAAEIAKELNAGGFCIRTDRGSLTAYLECYKQMAIAQEHVRREGAILTSKKGTGTYNPWYTVWSKNAELMKKFAVELGLTPRSRKTLGVKGAAAPDLEDIYGSPPGGAA